MSGIMRDNINRPPPIIYVLIVPPWRFIQHVEAHRFAETMLVDQL